MRQYLHHLSPRTSELPCIQLTTSTNFFRYVLEMVTTFMSPRWMTKEKSRGNELHMAKVDPVLQGFCKFLILGKSHGVTYASFLE